MISFWSTHYSKIPIFQPPMVSFSGIAFDLRHGPEARFAATKKKKPRRLILRGF